MITITKFENPYVKEIRNTKTNKIIQEVLINNIWYKRNRIYKTYNSIEQNDLLRVDDVEKWGINDIK